PVAGRPAGLPGRGDGLVRLQLHQGRRVPGRPARDLRGRGGAAGQLHLRVGGPAAGHPGRHGGGRRDGRRRHDLRLPAARLRRRDRRRRSGTDLGGERRGDHADHRRRLPRGRAGGAARGRSRMSTVTAGQQAARFAADLIRFDTTNRGGGDACERPAAEYVAERLSEAGLEPVLLESAPGRANVVARVSGAGEEAQGALLLHGHLDVVPADPAAWAVHPFAGEVRDGVLWGRGAVDMKNADAVLLALVSQWAREGRRPRRDLVLAFTADEEDTAAFGARYLVERHAELFAGCTEAVGESGAFTFHAGPGQRLYPVASA